MPKLKWCYEVEAEIGEEMRLLRESHNLSQAQIARFMRVSRQFICDLELGRRHWRQNHISNYLIAVKLNCNVAKSKRSPCQRELQHA